MTIENKRMIPESGDFPTTWETGPDRRSIGVLPFASSKVREAPDSIRAPATAKCPKCNALCKLLHPDSPS